MIYLILSPSFVDKDDISKGYKSILKIGYTGEESRKSRFDCYITENPSSKVLYLIEGGDLIDERNLHIYFKDLREVGFGKEWFKYDQRILDFFETHKTKESLQEIIVKPYYSRREIREIGKLKSNIEVSIKVNYLTNKIISKNHLKTLGKFEIIDDELFKSISKSLYNNYNKNLEEYIEKEYGLIIDFSIEDNILEATKEILSKQKLKERYESLCSLGLDTIKASLMYLPSYFINFCTVLGPEKMKALSFNSTDMKKEYEGIIGNQGIDIGKEIQNEFKIGERVSKNLAKKRLKALYEKVGYKKTPKAVDLGEYFTIKTVDIRNIDTGKRDKGYEILEKKII